MCPGGALGCGGQLPGGGSGACGISVAQSGRRRNRRMAGTFPAVLRLTTGGGGNWGGWGGIISVAEGQQSSAHFKGALLGVNVTEGAPAGPGNGSRSCFVSPTTLLKRPRSKALWEPAVLWRR